MTSTTITARLSGGAIRQQFYAEPTIVQEACVGEGLTCVWDDQCCPGLLCEWNSCVFY